MIYKLKAKTKTLPNGARLIFIQNTTIASAYLYLVGTAGAYAERKDEIGAAHFLEHMVFEGTKKYPTRETLRLLVDKTGAQLNARTGYYDVSFQFSSLAEDLETGFSLLSQFITEPLLRQEDIEKEKNIILQELKQRKKPTIFGNNAYKQLYSGNHRGFVEVSGNKKHISKMNQTQLKSFKDRVYGGANFVLAVSSNNSWQEIERLFTKYFSRLAKGEKSKEPIITLNKDFNIIVSSTKKQDYAYIRIHYWAYPYKDLAKLKLTIGSHIIRERLQKTLRDELGLVYSFSCEATANDRFGELVFKTKTSLENQTRVLKLIKDSLDELIEEGLTKEEFDAAHKHIYAAKILFLDTPQNQVENYANMYVYDAPYKNHYDYFTELKKITLTEVEAALKEVLSKPPRLAIKTTELTEKQVHDIWNN